jgi:adenylate cyclase
VSSAQGRPQKAPAERAPTGPGARVSQWFDGARRKKAAACGAILGGLGLLLSVVPAVLALDEAVGLGLLFAARGPMAVPDDVVVVNISRDSAAAVGQSEEVDEWPRSVHATLIDALSAAGVEAIAFDIMFEEPRADDALLAAAIRRAGNVILVERVVTEDIGASGSAVVVDTRRPPVAELATAALATAPFTLPRVPVRVSQFWTFGRAADDTPSLPVIALQAYLMPHYDELVALLGRVRPALLDEIPRSRAEVAARGDLGSVMRTIRSEFQRDPGLARELEAALGSDRALGALRILSDVYGGPTSRYLNLYGPPRTIRTIPFDLASARSGLLDLAGKMVFVGFAEPRQSEEKDFFYSVFSQNSGANLSGVEIGASAFANLLDRRSLIPLSMPTHLLLVIGWGFLLGLVVVSSTRAALTLAALAAALYAATAYWAFSQHAVWLPVLVPLFVQVPAAALGAVCLNYVLLMRQRERVQDALGYYVPRAFVNRLAEQSVSAAASRQLLHGACLFTDAEEYTTVSEALRPDDLAALMNDYYRVMFRVVERHGGMVSDTSGDSMVALWASAMPDPSSRIKACRAALEMVEAVAEFNHGRGASQLPTRVGLESGEVLLGNIGAEQRYEYRAIGDIVNTASRLQGLNRLLRTRVLVSDATVVGAPGLVTRDVGRFLLRGKKTPIRVHEPLGFAGAVSRETENLAAAFTTALDQFERERWAEARRSFAGILERFPGDGPSAFYLERCKEYEDLQRPWEGAISVTVK